ncbi:TetR/AcrR family transcriptional regulator [Ralstonia chuxiongensis]|uniref:TetR/AcrR family transcriptional regulator n=1 Tax=Ralstonia chuxiongensis TaxID=2957504 RepID=A0AA41WU27_9RALS|nr:TetR/AcrR family transcriptional regulator [Ralstonia chuxiongensis]MCP1174956.1 TetR/AcrR family transcriptional regulator [Ralstonia chuxiongensis]
MRLIEATIRLLAKNGPGEVKARSVTSEAGVSTMGVYTHFGGVPELLRAVADEGLQRLVAAFEQVPITDDPFADLCALSLACRGVARSNPHLYDLMFGLSIHGRYGPSWGPASQASSEHSPAFKVAYTHLVSACTRMVDAKCVRKTEPSLIAMQLWSAVHGFVMLELAGHFSEVADPPSEILVPLCSNVVIGLGAVREKVEASTAAVLTNWAGPSKTKAEVLSARKSRKRK